MTSSQIAPSPDRNTSNVDLPTTKMKRHKKRNKKVVTITTNNTRTSLPWARYGK